MRVRKKICTEICVHFYHSFKKKTNSLKLRRKLNPYLEIAEIHRRVIEAQGKALLFKRVKGSAFPVVTNLFGTNKRIEMAFGTRPTEFVKTAVEMVEDLLAAKVWQTLGLSKYGV